MELTGFNVFIDNIQEEVVVNKKKRKILSPVSLRIKSGEFIAIVGCSGAGKTTLMNILSGYIKPSAGHVYVEGLDILENEDLLKGQIAYVPQEEILDSSLTLNKSLEYSLQIRVPGLNKAKSKTIINRVLKTLELSHVKNTLIKNLSGGEKKRASIATEMLSDPSLFLLDEPTSGLDANIEKKIMLKLREIANSGKTIIITAHTVSNLHLCDKVLFMGTEGRICYYGPYNKVNSYFDVKEFVDIYDILKNASSSWYKKYMLESIIDKDVDYRPVEKKKRVDFFMQTITLVKRYAYSLFNNKLMFTLLLGESILMGVLMCLALEKDSLLNPHNASMICVVFTLASMWLGLFNTIQEIVKERSMLKKEYMSGLKFSSYISSKLIVVFFLCLYQAITCVTLIYFHLDPCLEGNLIFNSLIDLIINFFLIAFSTSVIGLFVSSLVKDTKTTLIFSPLYMMVQMLFSGMFIPFVDLTKGISYFTSGRWGFESFGSISNLTSYGVLEPSKSFFKYTSNHVLCVWIILIITSLCFLVFSIHAIHINILSKKSCNLILDDDKNKVVKVKHK